MLSAICFNLVQPRILSSGNGLTLILLFATINLEKSVEQDQQDNCVLSNLDALFAALSTD